MTESGREQIPKAAPVSPRRFQTAAELCSAAWSLFQALIGESKEGHILTGLVVHATCSCGSLHPVLDSTASGEERSDG